MIEICSCSKIFEREGRLNFNNQMVSKTRKKPEEFPKCYLICPHLCNHNQMNTHYYMGIVYSWSEILHHLSQNNQSIFVLSCSDSLTATTLLLMLEFLLHNSSTGHSSENYNLNHVSEYTISQKIEQ